MIPAPTPLRWRLAWAARENRRRQRAYDMAVAAWHRRDDELVRLRIEATGFLGCLQPRTGLPVDLDDDEVVYRVLPVAELVEAKARHILGLPAPGLSIGPAGSDTLDAALPGGLRVVDSGMAVVTNHRVAFAGQHRRRQWRYPEVVGPAHHPTAPLTLLHTTDGGQLAGLLVPAAATVNFRFYLTLALATANGERTTIATQVDALRHAHRKARPVPPPPAGPEHAPLPALPSGRLVTAAVVVAFACATLTAGTSDPEPNGPPHRAQPSPAGIGVTDAPDAVGGATPISLATLPVPGHRTDAPPAGPATVQHLGSTATPGSSVSPTARRTVTASPIAARLPTVRPTPVVSPVPSTDPTPTSSPTPTPTTEPAPTSPSPSSDPGRLGRCLDPLRLPLAERLLCP
ncbi:hypothetical protein C1I95_13655 [Micromonospora craterilacus]|uniref:Uncharacterized protein n=1 Tax=Micromonospora craterilacus TaxID=1655439 RepID=A0A2W2E2Z1_9ACTN|nr:hypothetical protein C1I95_13655 [Micromonospora craterilacus]